VSRRDRAARAGAGYGPDPATPFPAGEGGPGFQQRQPVAPFPRRERRPGRLGLAGLAALESVAEPLAVFLTTRGCLLVLAYAATALFPKTAYAAKAWPFGGLFDPWVRWDSAWYLQIASEGYVYRPEAQASTVAFFPLYPLLIRVAAPILGGPVSAGLVISDVALALALCCLYQLAARRFDRDVARRSALLLSCYPFAYFLGAVYTEGLFLLLAVAAFWLAERRRWWLAGLAAGLAGATRLVGATLGPALGLLYLEQRRYRPREVRPDALALGLAPLGLLVFTLYQYLAFGDPFVTLKSAWGYYNLFEQGPGRLSLSGFGPGNYDLLLAVNLAVAVLWLLAVVPVFRLLGPAYATFVLLSTLIPLSHQLESLGRFTSVLFPVFVVVAYRVRGRLSFGLLLSASALLLSVLTVLFASGYPVV